MIAGRMSSGVSPRWSVLLTVSTATGLLTTAVIGGSGAGTAVDAGATTAAGTDVLGADVLGADVLGAGAGAAAGAGAGAAL
jgi:hypothetical protein